MTTSNKLFLFVIILLAGYILFDFITDDKNIDEERAKHRSLLAEKDRIIELQDARYDEALIDLQRAVDAQTKSDEKLDSIIQLKDEKDIPTFEPVSSDSALLDSILYYARK